MKIQLIDINETFKNMPEVSSAKFLHRGKFDPDSIFSEQIFGPVDDFKCQCGKLCGQSFANTVCPNCKVLVTSSNVRTINMAKITVPDITTLVNPLIIEILEKFITKTLPFKLDRLIVGKDHIVVIDNKEFLKVSLSDTCGITGPVVFKDIVYPILLDQMDSVKEFDRIYGKHLFIKYIPVIPPNIRPLTMNGDNGRQFFIDDINREYMTIIRTINNINDSPGIFDEVMMKSQYVLQSKFNSLFKILIQKFEHKSGFLRQHVLGKRIDYSGRAVITVDGNDLPLGWCKIPFQIAKEVFKPQMITYMANKLQVNPLQILQQYDLEKFQDVLLTGLKERFIGYYVFINRQPTLHRPSMQSMKIYDIIKDDVIVIHPLVCEGYNADKQPSLSAVLVTACKKLPELLESLTR